jgi:hypothetical protein
MKEEMLFLYIFGFIFLYLCLGLVLWCLCPDMELLLDLASGLAAWVHQFFYQLVDLVKGASKGKEPMSLGSPLEQVPSAGGVGMSTPSPIRNSGKEAGQHTETLGTTSLMDGPGQGQVEGGHRHLNLDLNAPPPGPDSLCPREYRLAENKLKDILMGMNKAPRSDLLPHYEEVEPRRRETYVRSKISEYLKQHSPEDIQTNVGELLVMKKSSSLYKGFEQYLLQQKNRGEE